MVERQYNEKEIATILERAVRTDQTSVSEVAGGTGLNLESIQEIGRSVGISPEAIQLAAQSLDREGHEIEKRFLGMPIAVGRIVEFDRPITDDEWEQLVSDLRSTFEARGAVRYDGPFRQWTNGNLQALLEPTPKGHRLRLQTLKGNSRRQMTIGAVMAGVGGLLTLGLGLVHGTLDPGAIAPVAVSGLIGAALFVSGASSLPAWARKRRTQISEVITRLGKKL